jgi:osmotically-inducible protein OsmY
MKKLILTAIVAMSPLCLALQALAPTQDASDLASMIAKDTEGVRSVHNKIVVAP